jgi:hypothetical protein
MPAYRFEACLYDRPLPGAPLPDESGHAL